MDSSSIITQVSRDDETLNINTHRVDHVEGENCWKYIPGLYALNSLRDYVVANVAKRFGKFQYVIIVDSQGSYDRNCHWFVPSLFLCLFTADTCS